MHEGVPHTMTPTERFGDYVKKRHGGERRSLPDFLRVDAKRTAAAAKAQNEPTTFVTDKLRRKKPKPVDARRKPSGTVLPPPVPARKE